MSSEAERLHHSDTAAHKDLAAVFWVIVNVLAGAMVVAFPPTVALGAVAGWSIFGAVNLAILLYVVRLRRARGRVSSTEMAIGVFVGAFVMALEQWLCGGVHAPIEIVYALNVFGAAGVLTGRVRLVHLVCVVVAVLAPCVYGPARNADITASIVYALVLVMQAGFLYDYGQRLRAQRLALWEAEQAASARAFTDALTGLGNRRALETGLATAVQRASGGASVILAYLDLNGFKAYNDRFGHSAGDALLQRLGENLARGLAARGAAYRIGGDEFCVIVECDTVTAAPLVADLRAALTEQGPGFHITPSLGVVALPDEAADADAALRLADERMYLEKRAGRPSMAHEVSQVLVRVLREHGSAGLDDRFDLGHLARRLAVTLRLPADQHEATARAAELHDVGKIAMPDALLGKPGPLSASEWEMIRAHPVIGERILAGSELLGDVGRIVRSSHERVDGTGYPDRLAGEDIPLSARIVAVLDAYAAMRSPRPYRPALEERAALAELERCAGTQFDGVVVAALLDEIADASVPPGVRVA